MPWINLFKLQSILLKSFTIDRPIDENSLFLNKKIDPTLATGNFIQFLSTFGLNTSSSSSRTRNNFTIILLIGAFIKLTFILNLDPIINYETCFYLGDFTLLFKSLRKFSLTYSLLVIAFNIQTNYLFNHNSSLEWFEVFKCFDGNVVPASIGIRDKRVLKKMLTLTKRAMKSVFINSLTFSLVLLSFVMYLLSENFRSFDIKVTETIIVIFWVSIIMLEILCITGTSFTSNVCFQIICYYCFVNFKYYNESMNKLLIKIRTNSIQFKSDSLVLRPLKRNIIKLFLQQNYFLIRIMKYNRFWSSFYLITMINFIPAHLIATQQALFGHYISFQLRIMFWICSLIINMFIILSSLHVCYLANQIKVHRNHLIQLQFEPNLKLDIRMKIKVRITFTNKINCNFIISDIKHN